MKHILTLTMLLCLSLWLNAENPVKIVLLAGQSNMAGAGNFDALSDADKARVVEVSQRVNLVYNRGESTPLSYNYAQYQFDKRGYGNVFGPEIFIGVTLAEAYPEDEFLLIKRAQGGTSLYGAWNPHWTAEKAAQAENTEAKQKMKLVEEHMALIASQIARLEQEGRDYEIIGMAWMQGENDGARQERAVAYEENLKSLIKTYRDTYDLPQMPFVMGQINSRYGKWADGPATVRQAQADVADADEHCAVLRTSTDESWSDYPKTSDNVHYDEVGQKRLGVGMGVFLVASCRVDSAR